MNRRQNHKILRSFKHGLDLENTFEMKKTDAIQTVFSDAADNIVVYYKHGIRHCVIDDGFPYFYTIQDDNSLLFSSTCYSNLDFITHEHYSNFEDIFTVFKKLNTRNSKKANQFFIDAYQHFKLQKNATFSYTYNLENKSADDTASSGHVISYDIKSDFNLNMEFHFLDTAIVIRCKYKDNKHTQNKVKIYSGNFEDVCKHVFKEASIFSCLEDDTIEFNSDLNNLFRLSEIVDF